MHRIVFATIVYDNNFQIVIIKRKQRSYVIYNRHSFVISRCNKAKRRRIRIGCNNAVICKSIIIFIAKNSSHCIQTYPSIYQKYRRRIQQKKPDNNFVYQKREFCHRISCMACLIIFFNCSGEDSSSIISNKYS